MDQNGAIKKLKITTKNGDGYGRAEVEEAAHTQPKMIV